MPMDIHSGSYGMSLDIQGGHLGCPWTYSQSSGCTGTYRGSSEMSMDIQGGHLGAHGHTLGFIWDVLANTRGSSWVSMDIQGVIRVSMDIQGPSEMSTAFRRN